MSYIELATALIFVVIPLALTLVLRLGLERDIVIATVRSIIQLLIVGYILKLQDIDNFEHIFIIFEVFKNGIS